MNAAPSSNIATMDDKISIVKNDDFQTVGFQATCKGVPMFTFGLSPTNSALYVKQREATGEDMVKVRELMYLQTRLTYLEGFVMNWFNTATSNGMKLDDGIKFTERDKAVADCKKRIEEIINTFK